MPLPGRVSTLNLLLWNCHGGPLPPFLNLFASVDQATTFLPNRIQVSFVNEAENNVSKKQTNGLVSFWLICDLWSLLCRCFLDSCSSVNNIQFYIIYILQLIANFLYFPVGVSIILHGGGVDSLAGQMGGSLKEYIAGPIFNGRQSLPNFWLDNQNQQCRSSGWRPVVYIKFRLQKL